MESAKNLHLSAKEILEKDFKTSVKGYNRDEVDKYLDTVIKDYELFQKEMDALKQENTRLRKELDKAADQPKRQPAAAGNTNYDILKRLSNLEKHVFGSKLYEE
jgi:DivIVA domain-containing protein